MLLRPQSGISDSDRQYSFSCEVCECDLRGVSIVVKFASMAGKESRYRIRSPKMSEIDKLISRNSELEAANNALNARIRDLENLRENECARNRRMENEMDQELQKYQNLANIGMKEIAMYRELYEYVIARLDMHMKSTNTILTDTTTPSADTSLRSNKRKRTLLEESEECSSNDYSVTGITRGDVWITEVNPQGRFIKFNNKGNKKINLSGWQIIHKAGTLETVFKFHRSTKLEAGANIVVWSAYIGAIHAPPSNVVMTDQKWFVADNMITLLTNNEGES
ncbi:lamin Dm0-like [Formica exsecta]|uniref:lamin Dm0-like n=1 Tax=Formica exsecta TaxID=72781 RepID=UPI0011438CBB|nr:lamin Dm0-like [Formica exsecta]